MKAKPFHYRVGKIETRTPWFPPDPELLNAWRDDFFQLPEVDQFTFWLCGAAMESWDTDDIDIIITGEITDLAILEKLIVNAIELGFKHRQLIDIGWNNYYKKFLEKGPCERRAICCEHFYNNGWCNKSSCMQVARDVETIIASNEIEKNGEIVMRPLKNAEKISDFLWKVSFTSPSQKQISRIKSGYIYTSPPLIITRDIDFKDYVPWP